MFVSNNSVTKEGYIQRELSYVVKKAEEKPEGTIFLIPLRLEICSIPRRLSQWQYVDYFPDGNKDKAFRHILESLETRKKYQPQRPVETPEDEVPIRYRSMVYFNS